MSLTTTYKFPLLGSEPPYNHPIQFSLPTSWKKVKFEAPEPHASLTRHGYTYSFKHRNLGLDVTLMLETSGHRAQTRKWVHESQLKLKQGKTCTRWLSATEITDDGIELYPFYEVGMAILFCEYSTKHRKVMEPVVTELLRGVRF
ncbi:hypothetical protein [Armatimonas rosea]|uniref:Uncharacterized protein n=1 Tax=Armatimonas rosea TaxID=685828 RepID=A0A7W9W5C0_ARMRO|nr:hypothetical protein [Armatimonas rosea]MBB6050284.1 hypothetical protein [Armatimonas rosea]